LASEDRIFLSAKSDDRTAHITVDIGVTETWL